MTTTQILALLLALSAATHIGCAATLTARRSGTDSAGALLIGASATASALALYLTALAAYR
ncbi:hypothetical protein [Streptomyces sp. B6B3]|uniref:hypothetical protein n=1 Tax=Streptomyces sp. B6B3 TaxID=3153570 RepID=UPI00325F1C08